MTLIQEIHRTERHTDPMAAVTAIRRAVFAELDITLGDIVIVEPGFVPKTSSGKVRRQEAKSRYLSGEYSVLSVDSAS